VGAVYVYLAVVVLSLISTEEQTGFFGASFRIFIVLGAVGGLLVTSAFPILVRAARDDEDRFAYAFQRLWEMLLVLGVGVALCTVVGARVAIDVVAGEGFGTSVDVLRIQSLALLATYLIAVWVYALLSLGLYRAILVANVAALVVSLTLTLVLGELYGANGAAVATVFGEATLAIGYLVALMIRRPDLRLSLGIVPRVAVALALGAAVVAVPNVPEALRLVAVGLVYAGGAWAVGAIPPEVGRALRAQRGD
jgi:O-antigen/teichoic acid export membrane protein